MPKIPGRGVARMKAGIKAPAAPAVKRFPAGAQPFKLKTGATGRGGQVRRASGRAKK